MIEIRLNQQSPMVEYRSWFLFLILINDLLVMRGGLLFAFSQIMLSYVGSYWEQTAYNTRKSEYN